MSLSRSNQLRKDGRDPSAQKDACLEEIAYLNGWITKEQVLETYEVLKKNQYGKYLKDVLDGKYVDKLHNREF